MLMLNSPFARSDGPSVAFFYGRPVPEELLTHFDWVIVEADNLGDPRTAKAGGAEIFAYVSVGEVERWRSTSSEVDKDWILGVNPSWGNNVADITRPGWQEYLLERRMAPLWALGYRGFFLDTLDSYRAVTKDETVWAAQVQALVGLIQAMHRRFPGIKLLLNRGFEILPQVASLTVGVAVESLFCGWDPTRQRYRPVSDTERAWLLERLREIRNEYSLPVIVIDYLPPDQKDLACRIARRIAKLGFTPWVANWSLDVLGVGAR
jgi:hypothetical protein